ncbi:YceI family protein [Sphingomonas sp. AX6]|uniref:YceI family protein n=1 Tax=Sphingomonas sp. AX6 TaxID=2653171 RepID=UPI0012EFDA9B|nr:YceI family protein [Sphingomonas sp. AX6]VXC75963.1 Polyisoprenoid-binding protein YceI [Sphingomonas sp. AX6]
MRLSRPVLIASLTTAALAAPVIAQQAGTAPAAIPGAPDATRVTAGNYAVDPSHTQVMWRVNHFGFNDYFGLFGDVKGNLKLDPANLQASAVEITIPLRSLKTNSDGLTKHLSSADFFEFNRFEEATFRSTAITLDPDGIRARIDGNLTLKGQTRPLSITARFEGAGTNPMNKKETVGFHGLATIKRSEFGISYALPNIPDDVNLAISVAFEKQ